MFNAHIYTTLKHDVKMPQGGKFINSFLGGVDSRPHRGSAIIFENECDEMQVRINKHFKNDSQYQQVMTSVAGRPAPPTSSSAMHTVCHHREMR